MKTCGRILATCCLLAVMQKTMAQQIKVMTYNIYHGEKHYDNGKSNLQDIAAVINEYKPDFVAMQEVDSMTSRTAKFNAGVKKDLVKELAKLTGMHGFFGKAMDYSEGGYGEGMLSRFPAVPVVYHLPTPKGGEPRAMIAIEHRFANGKKMIFAGTHFCHEFEENRVAQAADVARILADKKMPVVIGGDFNIVPGSKPYQEIVSKLADAAQVFGSPELTFPFTGPKYRLDYIFLNQGSVWKIKDVKVIKADASDHKPVLMTLELVQ